MKNFILSAETACDLTNEQAKALGIEIMPMNYYVDGEEFNSKDGTHTIKDLCDLMKGGAKTKTSQPNDAEIEDYLTNLLKHGKDILHLSFSSAMSGTYEHFKLMAEKLNKNHENKIYVVDTLCQSGGIALLLKAIIDKVNKDNSTIKETITFAETLKHNIVHYFVVEDLKYLARGGRISTGSAVIGNIIKLKPVLHLDNVGKITQLHKVIGRKKSISTLIDKFRDHYNGKSRSVVITQADCEDEAEFVKAKILELNPTVEVLVNPLGPIITSHSGPGTLALFFTADERV